MLFVPSSANLIRTTLLPPNVSLYVGGRPTKEAVGDSIRMWREGLRDSAANTIRTT